MLNKNTQSSIENQWVGGVKTYFIVMDNKFDLTTEKGLKTASDIAAVFPMVSLASKIGKAILSRNTESVQNQRAVAEALIEKGYRNGVDEMEITMDNTTGAKISIPMDKCSVETMLGADDKLTLRVKFK